MNQVSLFRHGFLACVLMVVALCPAFAAKDRPSTEGTTVTFHSKSLEKDVSYVALCPTNMDKSKKYPVLYLLHGAWGSYADWPTLTPLAEILAGRDLIVITPDGSQFGWYTDSVTSPTSRYESFVTKDLIAEVDGRFPTDARREARGIAGLSMGGHGAITLAGRHPDLFGSASSMSGILRPMNHPGKWHMDEAFGPMKENEANWRAHSAYDLADTFSTAGVALYFDTGSEDSTEATKDARQFDERLTNRGIAHSYLEFPGEHNWPYWNFRVPSHINFHLDAFAGYAKGQPLPSGKGDSDHYTKKAMQFEEQTAKLKSTSGTVVLLGSSSYEMLPEKKLFPEYHVINRGISGDTVGLESRGLLHRLFESVIDLQPDVVFVLNGTNDLAQTARKGSPKVREVAEGFGDVVKRIRKESPRTHVVIVSCTPTRGRHAGTSTLIADYNKLLRKYAEAGDPMISYLDTWSQVVDGKGYLRPEYSLDGLHMNPAGYDAVKKLYLDELERLQVPKQ